MYNSNVSFIFVLVLNMLSMKVKNETRFLSYFLYTYCSCVDIFLYLGELSMIQIQDYIGIGKSATKFS